MLLDFRQYHNSSYYKQDNNSSYYKQDNNNQPEYPPNNSGRKNSRWPKTVIMVGMKDPLYDDSLRLHEKLINNGIDSRLIVYKQHIHGFLNLDRVITACEKTIDDSMVELQRLIISQGGTCNGHETPNPKCHHD